MSAHESLVIPHTVRVQHPNDFVEEMQLDEYVKGVVPTILGLPAPIEALKALAVAVRSDAVTARRHARDGFDLCTTDHCQLWRPTNRYPDSDQAVDATAAQVLTVKGQIAAAPYFEHCDGHTREGGQAWGIAAPHCRSVACGCGYSQLRGHGVGLCVRGSVAMARQGATAEEILKHYYAQVEAMCATAMPRAALRHSLLVGRVLDSAGQPISDARLVLAGAGETWHKAAADDGRFWFGGLPSGEWELRVKGKAVGHGALRTDGRNTVEVELTVPDRPLLVHQTVSLAHLPSPLTLPFAPLEDGLPGGEGKCLVGTLGYESVLVTLIDGAGREQTALSGSAPEFNPGGFAFALPAPGRCTLRVFDQSFEVEVGNTGVWVRFSKQTG